MAAAPDPVEVLRSTSEKTNFQRLARLLISGGTFIMRDLFDAIHPPRLLPTRLSSRATKNQLKAAKLTRPQWDCLYPSPGVYGKSTAFDITLLFRLLRTICNLSPPTTGWDALPASTDHSLTADLARVKSYRNSVYGHVKQSMEVTNDEFLSLWQEISETLVRIAGQISRTKKIEWQQAIEKLLVDPLTVEVETNVEELRDWYRRDMKVKKTLEGLISTAEDVRGRMGRLEATVRENSRDIQKEVKNTTEEVIDVMETIIREETKDIKDQLREVNQSIKRLAQVKLVIDCKATSGSGRRGEASGMFVGTQEFQAGIQRAALPPRTFSDAQPVVTTGFSRENVGNGGVTSAQDVLNFIASKLFQAVDPTKPEELNGFVTYLREVRKVLLIDAQPGSLIITVECSSLQILNELWEDYRSGHLSEMAQTFLVTEDILTKFGLNKVELTTTIMEEEYNACREYFLKHPGHKVTPVKQFQAEDYEALLKRKAFCAEQYHDTKEMEFYCRVCETCICQICCNTEHKNHEIEPLEKAADSERDNILAGVDLMKQKNEVCNDLIRRVEEFVSRLETTIAAAKRQVSQAAEQMIAAIQKCEREAITTLENTRVAKMKKLDSLTKEIEMLAKQINQAAEFANDLVQRSSSGAEIMQNKRNLEERFEELDKTALPSLPVGPFIRFVSTCKPDNASLGFISETDPNRSIMEGLDQNYQAGVEAEVLICPKMPEGQISNKQHEDLVEVLVEPNDQLASLMIKKKCKPDNASLGFISETDPNRSIMEGLDQNYQAGVEAEVLICPKMPEGQISNKQHEDLVEVLVEPNDQLASLMIKKKSGGNFQVKFVSMLPGTYHISAKINGDNLAKSPFAIEVKKRRLELVGELDLQNETLKRPAGITVSSKGLIAIADCDKHCILIFDKDGKYVRQLGCYGENPGELKHPVDVTFMSDDEILVADKLNNRIQMFNVHNGNYVKSFGKKGTGEGEFHSPSGVCMDVQGHVVVAEFHNNRVQVLTKDGAPVLKFGDSGPEKLNHPLGCVCYKNMYIVTDSENGSLKVFDSSGRFLRKIGKKGKADGQFTKPWGLCMDKHGNFLVGDRDSGHVQQCTIEGHFTGKTVAKLQRPKGITTMADGRILISDRTAKKVFILK